MEKLPNSTGFGVLLSIKNITCAAKISFETSVFQDKPRLLRQIPIFPNSIAGFKKYPNGNGRWIPACANGSSRGDLQQHHARCKVAGISPQGRGGWSVGFAFVV